MLTFSETILTAAIWILTCAGLFFGLRAKVRRRRSTGKTQPGEFGPEEKPGNGLKTK